MKYIIPSKDRSNTIREKTIRFLLRLGIERTDILVFVPESQVEEYSCGDYVVNGLPDSYNLMDTLNYIHQEFLEEGEKAVRCDDDIEEMYYCSSKKSAQPITPELFDYMIDKVFGKLGEIKLAGINPTGNPFFTSHKIGLTRGSYIVGAFQMFINDREAQKRTYSSCEDVEQICKHIEKHSAVVKVNCITIKTKWFGIGGLEDWRKKNVEKMIDEHRQLENEYGYLFTHKFTVGKNNKFRCKFRWRRNRLFAKEEFV